MSSSGGSEILSEQPSFPFPPALTNTTSTPLGSLIFLTDAIYDQCSRTPDGTIRVKDVVDLIENDPSNSVVLVLGLPPSHGVDTLFSPADKTSPVKKTITREELLAVFQRTKERTELKGGGERKDGSNTPGAVNLSGGSSSLHLPSLGMNSETLSAPLSIASDKERDGGVEQEQKKRLEELEEKNRRRTAEVRGTPFPKLPPDDVSLPPKAPKRPLPRSPKRKKFTIGVEGGNVRADARGRYAEVLRDDPNNIDALEHIGYFYVNAEQPTKALEALNRARTLGCDNLRLWRSTGRAHFLKWRQEWKKLESELGATDIPMKRILIKMPDDEHLQAAHLAYERCTRFHLFVPESKFWHELAEIYFHYRAYEGSMSVLVHITRDDPTYDHLTDIIFMCGIMYYRLKKYNESIECFKKVLHAPPDGWKERNILFLLARLYKLNGDEVNSLQSYEEVYDFVRKKNLQVSEEQRSRVNSTRDYVQDPDTWYNESKLYVRSGYYELAEDALNMALKYSYDVDAKLGVPNYSKEKLKDIWVGLSRTYAFRSNFPKSLECMVEAQAARPYDYYVRACLTQMDPDPDKWTDVFVMESKHALMLSRLVRGHLERQRVRREKKIMGNAATKMARIFRGVRWRVRLKGLYLTLVDRRNHVRSKRSQALIRMQSVGRMLKMRNYFFLKKLSALKISSAIRGMLGRLKALRRRNEVMEEIRRRNYKAATTIQSAARGFALRTQLNRNWAAIDLQALARGYIQRRKTYLTIKEPQLVETSRSGYPRGTPGHRRHWQRRLEQCEFLYSDRMELRREIGVLCQRHPCITPHEAFLALAVTTGDVE